MGGVALSYPLNTPSGGTIVLLAVGLFVVTALVTGVMARVGGRGHDIAETHAHEHGVECGHPAVTHGDHVDYVHDGHLHAAHEGHYDEHGVHHDNPSGPAPETAGAGPARPAGPATGPTTGSRP